MEPGDLLPAGARSLSVDEIVRRMGRAGEPGRRTAPRAPEVHPDWPRGDHDLNEGKLRDALGVPVHLADDVPARRAGFAIGFVSPAVVNSITLARMVIDPDAAQGRAWVTGADRVDYHVHNFDWRQNIPN